jgi:hypothetical protein
VLTEGAGLRSNAKGLVIAVYVLGALFVSALSLLALLNRRDQVVGLKQDIRYDDFAFSVLEARSESLTQSQVNDSTDPATLCVLTLKIDNRAGRVDYQFNDEIAVLVDERGREYRPVRRDGISSADAGRPAAERCDKPIPAGSSCTTDLTFELPADSQVSHLRISHGGNIGYLLDLVFYGNKRIALGAELN